MRPSAKTPLFPLQHGLPPFKVAIVGCGPKGLYGLEHLLGELALTDLDRPVEIHIFNKSPHFGAGDIYRTDQPPVLLMNFPNGYINMWRPGQSEALVDRPLSFVDWLIERSGEGTIDKEDLKNEYATRATVGRYLHQGYNMLLEHCPAHVQIIAYTGEVQQIAPEDGDYTITVHPDTGGTERISDIQHILLTTGHQSASSTEAENLIHFIYPVNKRLSRIAAGAKVAIKGMGLTFIDAALALTEGRGGHFMTLPGGDLQYQPSGREPQCLYPFSTSGLPMIPRKGAYQSHPKSPVFFHKDYFKTGTKIDFEKDLWPLILSEIKLAYYSVLFRQHNRPLPIDLTPENLQVAIEDFHREHPEVERFGWQTFTSPMPENTDESEHTLLTRYIRYTLNEAEKGTEHSPCAAAANSWRYMSALFNELYSFGGLRPASQEVFHTQYAGHLNRITYGPPLVNMKKVLALAEAGYIDFSYARNPVLQEQEDGFVLKSQGLPACHVDYMADARIPRNNILETDTPLYADMLRRGMIIPYENKEGEEGYRPGCMALTRQGNPILPSGEACKTITVSGTPTEGITYDNDTLSRSRNDFTAGWVKRVLKAYETLNTTVADDN